MADQRVWLVGEDDRVQRTYLVSGSLTDNLQPGTYRVYSTSRHAVGIDDSGTMKYMVRFAHGPNAAIGFHDIPVLDSGRCRPRPARHPAVARMHPCSPTRRARRCGTSRRSGPPSSSRRERRPGLPEVQSVLGPPEPSPLVAALRGGDVVRLRGCEESSASPGDAKAVHLQRSRRPSRRCGSGCGSGSARAVTARRLALRTPVPRLLRGLLGRGLGRDAALGALRGCPCRGRGARRWSRSPSARRTAGRASC